MDSLALGARTSNYPNQQRQTQADFARPFVKWVGGKSQILPQIDRAFPNDLKSGKRRTYIEPFVGGGAVFFHVAQTYPIDSFIIADNNRDLILAYWTVRDRVGQLITVLHDLQAKYLRLDEAKREDFFYRIRDRFNKGGSAIDVTKPSNEWIERAAHFVFLNKTCFNGLFRVNSSGAFNAAFGRYDNPKISDPDNLVHVSYVLRRAQILLCDFDEVIQFVNEDSFVYLDPPYRPLNETANFTGYSASTFTALDQQRLAHFCSVGNKCGAAILMSNADPTNEDEGDRFFEETYQGFRIKRIEANRMINCRADKRGKIRELLISNY
jgi:DNA adenine methylase